MHNGSDARFFRKRPNFSKKETMIGKKLDLVALLDATRIQSDYRSQSDWSICNSTRVRFVSI